MTADNVWIFAVLAFPAGCAFGFLTCALAEVLIEFIKSVRSR